MKIEVLAVLSFITVTMAYLFTPILPEEIALELFFDFIALSFSLLWLFVYLKTTGFWSTVFFVFFLVSLNNLADELFWNPTKYDLNELVGAILIAVITIIFKKRWMR